MNNTLERLKLASLVESIRSKVAPKLYKDTNGKIDISEISDWTAIWYNAAIGKFQESDVIDRLTQNVPLMVEHDDRFSVWIKQWPDGLYAVVYIRARLAIVEDDTLFGAIESPRIVMDDAEQDERFQNQASLDLWILQREQKGKATVAWSMKI
jgi:hypothetical protein